MKTINNFSIVCRNGKALVMNHNTNKYNVLADSEGSTVMASIRMLANLVEKFEQTEDILNIVFIPRNLGGILRLTAVDEWIKNGNKTNGGTELSAEYVELAKYITDMRKWLGTNNLILKIQGGELVRANEKIMIDKAWRQLDKVAGKAKGNNNVTRPAMSGSERPVVPSSVRAMNDIEL